MLDTHQHQALPPSRNAAAEADLATIAFYFLLRVGEYTPARSNHNKHTHTFCVKNVIFWDSNGFLIPHTSTPAQLDKATKAAIVIPTQKNGIKGQCIHQDCTGTAYSPVKALARRVHHILSNNGTLDTPIHCYYNPLFTHWKNVTADNINNAVRAAAGQTGLYTRGYEPSDVSSHSLRAGGAMALYLHKVPISTIKKMGRWKSDAFQMYIHEQISAFSAGLSIKMADEIPFKAIPGPRRITHV